MCRLILSSVRRNVKYRNEMRPERPFCVAFDPAADRLDEDTTDLMGDDMRRAWVAAVIAMVLALAGCGGRPEGNNDLVIISPHDEKITQEFAQIGRAHV